MNRPRTEGSDISLLLRKWSDGKPEALEALIPLVYRELHAQAVRFLRKERSDHTLQPSALVNEAYIKLAGQHEIRFEDRTHFFAVAAETMRHILVDHARAKRRRKRGGSVIKVPLEEAVTKAPGANEVDIIALNDALNRLAEHDAQQARIVELRFFGGLGLDDTAAALRISKATVIRDWKMAKAWLFRKLRS